MNAWEWIQSDPEVDRSQIYPIPCKQGLNLPAPGIITSYDKCILHCMFLNIDSLLFGMTFAGISKDAV